MFRVRERLKPKLRVEAVSIAGSQQNPSQSLQIRVRKNSANDQLGHTAAPVTGHDKHIGEVGEASEVRDDSGETNLSSVAERGETERILDGAFHDA